MAWSGAWKHLIESANWIRQRLRVHDARLRCDACRAEFIPGPAGAATFIDELNSIRLIVCSLCESRLLLRGAPALRQRSREAREVADNSINREDRTPS
jgi:DNA-directed RNA polymerase subunit RPC12/RpoP